MKDNADWIQGTVRFLPTFLALLCCMVQGRAQDHTTWFGWGSERQLPVERGLSGMIAGMSNGVLIVAGGSNFDRPLQQGGKKKVYDDIYVCTDPSADTLTWIKAGRLPFPLTDAAMVPYHNGLLCLGGTDGSAPRKEVFWLGWDAAKKAITVKQDYPALPAAVSGAAAVRSGARIYVAGGMTAERVPLAGFWSLLLDGEPDGEATASSWDSLPGLPGGGRFGAALAAQNDGEYNCIFLTGGKSGDVYCTDLYKYPLRADGTGEWVKLKDPPRPAFFARTMTYGQGHILLWGGSAGPDAATAIAMGDKYEMARDILAYHAITNTWVSVGQMPEGVAGAALVRVKNRILVIGGELRPGQRTAHIQQARSMLVAKKSQFGFIDYATILIYLVILGGISYYFSRKKHSADDYFRGSKRIPFWAAGISVMATQVSAIGFMSIPAKSYASNWSYFSGVWTWFLVVPIVTWAFIPFFRKLDVTSAYEYLERRFNVSVRLFSGVIYCCYQIGKMGLVIYLPAVALSAVTPIDTFTCILIMGGLSTLYTVLGGIEAVIWIEVLQTGLLMGGAVICIILALWDVDGGLPGFFAVAMDNNKFSFGSLDLDFTSSALGVILIGNIFNRLGNLISDQAIVQRYMTTKSLKAAQQSLWVDVLVSVPWAIIVYLLGTALYIFYKSHPGLLNPAMPTDGVLPQFISQRAPKGLSGLIIAGIFAASMASIESHIHSLATIFTTDFYARFSRNPSEKRKLVFARSTTAMLGVVATLIALLLLENNIKSILDVFTEMTGLFIGAAAGLFLLGIFTERTNGTGALAGAIGSCVILYFIQTETRINFWLYSAIGFVACFVIGYLCSLLVPGKRSVTGLTIYTLNQKIT
ncbi:sodium:solute symporter family transporter [Compostibacter hankyongensis]